MFYLVVRNLGVIRCIHSGEEDVYTDGMCFPCTPEVEFPGGELVKDIRIVCSEDPGLPIPAKVFSD
jgi:hypothetical protein